MTVHWKDDRWVDIQLKYLNKNINVPFRVYAFLNSLPGNHRSKYFYASTEDIESHAVKLNLLADMAAMSHSAGQDDWLMFIDGDAFPIADIVSFGRDKLGNYPLLAIRRTENNGDIQPHPCFCLTTIGFWKDIDGDWNRGYEWRDPAGRKVTDVGGNLLEILNQRRINWYPMSRSNKRDMHPLWFGIYEDVIYHHGAGFRQPRSRIDSQIHGIEKFHPGDRKRIVNEKIIRPNTALHEKVYQSILDDTDFYRYFQKPESPGCAQNLLKARIITGETLPGQKQNQKGPKEMKKQPKVAVITRTKNRDILMGRAVKSVLDQTFTDWIMVIVNDGGDRQKVDEVMSEHRDLLDRRIKVIHNETSVGMEAASNIGLKNSRSKYVVIHDDDDSWDPLFLEKCVGHMENRANKTCGGVVTHILRVEEDIRDGSVRTTGKSAFNSWLRTVDISEMASVNLFLPISFLYKRQVLNEIGWYKEDLPVVGDWEFNLRFLTKYDIHVIPELLANYHLRPGDHHSPYANTLIGQSENHQFYTSLIRNAMFRDDLEKNQVGPGLLVSIAQRFFELSGQITRLEKRMDSLKSYLLLDVKGELERVLGDPRVSPENRDALDDLRDRLTGFARQEMQLTEESDLRFALFRKRVSNMITGGQINGNDHLCIFGASHYGEQMHDLISSLGLKVACFFDNDPAKIGGALNSIPIRSPESPETPGTVIVSSVGSSRVIHEQMETLCKDRAVRILSCYGFGI